MKLNTDYNIIGEFDISRIVNELGKLAPEVWDLNQSRQNKFGVHIHTKSIFINDVPISWDGAGYYVEQYFVNDALNSLTNDIVTKLENHFSGKVGKTLYINLPAKQKIATHTDNGYYLTGVHRCHIPIITNDQVDFILGKQTVHMKPGVCYEINNAGLHGVVNNSDTDRIHLLIDIIPPSLIK